MKRTRRFLGLFLSLVLLFSACDSSQPTGDSEAGTTALAEDITEGRRICAAETTGGGYGGAFRVL